jgi:rSAM/selenodomain-associated transferase 1
MIERGGKTGRCAIAIMAKAPVPGRSKTRLCPPLTPQEAAGLSSSFLADMAATLCHAGTLAPIDPVIAYAPAGTEAALRQHLPAGLRLLLADGAGIDSPGVTGFGCVLLQTCRFLLAEGYGAVCVLNSDSPNLPADLLIEAASLLATSPAPVVLGPAVDGGYYLLGLTQTHATLFADIAWSTENVAAQTRAQAERAGLVVETLAPWYDVDDAASLRRLLHDLDSSGAATAPATAARLDALGLRTRLASPA